MDKLLNEDKQRFIEKYLPNYHHDDRVLQMDILSRWCDGETISDADVRWIDDEWEGNASEVAYFVKVLEEHLYKEATIASTLN